MTKLKSIANFVLFGSQKGQYAEVIYQQILKKIQESLNSTVPHFILANPQNIDSVIKNLKEPTLFFPLYLMEGIEYQNFKSNIANNFRFENTIALPLSNYLNFLKVIFNENKNTIFLMHGSNRYENWDKHQNIISFGVNLGFQHFCFLEGSHPYKELISKEILKLEPIKISPLFFIKGNHIQNDLINQFLEGYQKDKWQVGSCLLERSEIINSIIEIATKELE